MNEQSIHWTTPGQTRVPYALYLDHNVPEREQQRIFRGATWNYLCLGGRSPRAGHLPHHVRGRDAGGRRPRRGRRALCVREPLRARGALIALEKSGRTESFQCVYHAWSYNLQGDLTGVAFEKGVKGQGGMPASFCKKTTRRASCASPPSAAWCSAASATTCPSSRTILATTSGPASSACSAGRWR